MAETKCKNVHTNLEQCIIKVRMTFDRIILSIFGLPISTKAKVLTFELLEFTRNFNNGMYLLWEVSMLEIVTKEA
jgi:hypothetical protein